jgi:copper chaperone CopZ
MKRTILITALMLFMVSFTFAQKEDKKSMPKQATTVIQLDKFCCKSEVPIVEKTLAYEKGVKGFEVSVENKNVTVVYKPKSTSPETIAKALAKAGVEANGIEADARAIEKLPTCCKNTAKGLSSGCEH